MLVNTEAQSVSFFHCKIERLYSNSMSDQNIETPFLLKDFHLRTEFTAAVLFIE